MEILGKILGTEARVKIMRLFLLNKGRGFTTKDVVNRSRVSSLMANREMRLLASIGFIKKRTSDWAFNYAFKYTNEFEDLLVRSDTLNKQMILDHFKKVGSIKLLITSGIFIKNEDSRVDLLIVGDKIKSNKIEDGVKRLEALIGTELTYAVFDKDEFVYRFNMYDKLVRDIIDFPHEVVFQSKELSTQVLKKVQKLV
ncbi:MAG: hypothetical protein AAB510_01465 [Patescibacteria group bacterium]